MTPYENINYNLNNFVLHSSIIHIFNNTTIITNIKSSIIVSILYYVCFFLPVFLWPVLDDG